MFKKSVDAGESAEDCSQVFAHFSLHLHDDLESLVLLANQVLHRNLDILKGDVCSTRAPYTLAVHAASGNTAHFAFDEKDRHTAHTLTTSSDSSGEVVTPEIC